MNRCITVILGGGRGSRLYPLTAQRAKPAVPLAGKYRLIDIPISNSINSGLQNIYVLTQFLSNSLNTHINKTYRFDVFSDGFVEIIAAEQRDGVQEDWFQGTADAVRKGLMHMRPKGPADEVLILSGDHLYRQDYQELLATHRAAGADITVSCIPVTRAQCSGFGVLAQNEEGRVVSFMEKPADDADLSDFELPESRREGLGDRIFMASMGVYVFNWGVLQELLADEGKIDFGKDILPAALSTHRVAGHVFDGYWEDIGTIRSFFEANLMLADPKPAFRFYAPEAPIYTRPRFLPPSALRGTRVVDSLISDGCLVEAESIRRSIIGLRSRIASDAVVRSSVLMGADYFEDARTRARNLDEGRPDFGVGHSSVVENAIVDKNARIGAHCVIRGTPGPDEHHEDAGWSMVDGIAIIHKNALIPDGTVIGG
ncbi:MAG: glucose-1-phosphate adenylyltransferase [Deltaproteobacteria bacterium]|nr:glucose-1-phosphate adenylyltransferase [Deltaproteobacteria bacterium]